MPTKKKNSKNSLVQAEEENLQLYSRVHHLECENEKLRKELAARELKEISPGLGSMPTNTSQELFSTGAVRRKTVPCRLDLIPLEALEGYGDRLHYGATVRDYGERNWEKGITYANLIQHAQIHLSRLAQQIIASDNDLEFAFLREQTFLDKDSAYGNACAALWNLAAIVTFLRRGNPAEKKG